MISIDPQLEAETRGDIPAEHTHVIGVSIAPNGRYAVVMLTAGEGPAMEFDETAAERVGNRWHARSSGTLSSTIYFDDDYRAVPLCNYNDPLPADVDHVVICDRGKEHVVPIENGYYLYVAWKAAGPEDATDPPKPAFARALRAT